MDFETWIGAVAAQESGGNYLAVNPRTGATGKFQIMPENWSSWSQEALGYEGDIQNPEHQEAVSRFKLRQYFDEFGPEGALAAWYAGPTNGARWRDGDADAIGAGGHYSWDARQGNGDEPSVREYIQQALGKAGVQVESNPRVGQFGDTSWLAGDIYQNSFGTTAGNQAVAPVADSWTTYMKDNFAKSWNEGILGANIRNIWGSQGYIGQPPLEVTKELIDEVATALPGDKVAQRWVLLNAGSEMELRDLIRRKQEDAERERRMEEFQGSWVKKAPGFIAGVAGAAIQDPALLIPGVAGMGVGKAALTSPLMRIFLGNSNAVGTIAKLGPRALSSLPMQTLLRYGENAGIQAGFNMALGKATEDLAGTAQDYGSLAMMGAFAGAGLSALGDVAGWIGRSRVGQTAINSLDNMQKSAATKAMGLTSPNEMALTSKVVGELHQPEIVKLMKNATVETLASQGKLAVLSGDDLAKVASRLGIDPKDVPGIKAFHDPVEGYTVLNASAIKPEMNLDNILKHEIGVHQGIAQADKEAGARLQREVEKKMARPDETWREAMRMTPGGGWEEVFGHWIEMNADTVKPTDRVLKQANYVFNKLRGTDAMTNQDLKDFATRSLRSAKEQAQGYRVLPDGSAVDLQTRMRYSKESLAHPEFLKGLVDYATVEPKGILSKISRSAEAGYAYGTVYGTLRNSEIPALREFAGEALEDARMRAKSPGAATPITLEKQKEYLKGQQTIYLNKYIDTRGDYIAKTAGGYTPSRGYVFDQAVIDCFNQRYGGNIAGGVSAEFPAEVVKAAGHVKELLDLQIKQATKSGEMFGLGKSRNMLPKEWNRYTVEIPRSIDDTKHTLFMEQFKDPKAGIEFLENYYKAFAKREDILRIMKDELTEKVNKLKAEGKDVSKVPKVITEEDVEARVAENAKSWAMGVGDQNLSNLPLLKGSNAKRLGAEGFLAHKFPLDTSGRMLLPNGTEFSYVKNLQSHDLERILRTSIDRVSGEMAIHNRFADMDELVDLRARAESALNHAVKYGKTSPHEAKRQLDAFDMTIRDLRGLSPEEDINSTMGRVLDTMRSIAYAKNGAMFGFNQLMEMGGVIGHQGFGALSYLVPNLPKAIREMRLGKGGGEAVERIEHTLFGETTEKNIWRTNWESRRYAEDASRDSWGAKVGDTINETATLAGRLTTSLSQLPQLTDAMIRNVRKDMIADAMLWAEGKTIGGVLRNPFSDVKLSAAGVFDKEALKADLMKYREGPELNTERWLSESPKTFWQFKNMVDNAAQRAIVSHTLGNKNILANKSPFRKFLFQFKDFAFKTMNSQLARAMTHKEIDSFLAMMYSMGTNAIGYSALTYAKAWAYHGDNQGKRGQYLKERLTPEMIAKAAFFRGSVGTALSFATDAYEAATGSGTFRTTVQADVKAPKREVTMNERIGRAVQQLPAVGTAVDVMKAGGSLYDLGRHKADQRDLQNLFNLLPARNFLPMVKGLTLLQGWAGLPERRRE